MRTEYIVDLPEEGVNMEGYDRVKKLTLTRASSPAKAVANVVFRGVGREQGRLITSELKKRGYENFASEFEVPEVISEDGSPLNYADRRKMTEYALAFYMAGEKTPELSTIRKARVLLEGRVI